MPVKRTANRSPGSTCESSLTRVLSGRRYAPRRTEADRVSPLQYSLNQQESKIALRLLLVLPKESARVA